MLFWEDQSWKPGGRSARLTLWSDGRSEIQVTRPVGASVRARPGWAIDGWRFVRKDPLPREAARSRFARAVAAGITELQTFDPDYVDGAGTLVGYRRGGTLQETLVPRFPDARRGSANEQTFQRVAAVMAEFETDAYEPAPPQ